MSAPHASEVRSIGEGDLSDASDAFDACRSGEASPKEVSSDEARSAGKRAVRITRSDRAKQARTGRRGAGAPLLDSSSPSARSLAPQRADEAADDAERRLPFEVFRAVWPALDTLRGTSLDLVSVTLTSPLGEEVREAAERFALDVAHDDGAGVLLAGEHGRRAEHRHFHGLVLTKDRPSLRDLWRELAGARADLSRATTITGWPLATKDREKVFARNLNGVIWYAFEPWHPSRGVRSLDRDVVASGAFVAPWRAARAALEAGPLAGGEGAEKASGSRRTCQRCGRELPPRKRAHTRWCSAGCRSAAYEQRNPHRKRGPMTPGEGRNDPR